MSQPETSWLRLDKFLVFARFCKTRSVAEAMIEKGAVRINRQPTDKPHAKLRPGDVLTLALPQGVKVVEIILLPGRRGSATVARKLYREVQ
ncbi:RNA-binding S4 domain-containing protein [Acidocella sp.]|uniref:RNA-binding S4 domain-containing protein n=1 Tax=Acidocella sp. TaxID=50710 RepID=UPI0026088BA3|nr:RNA-binding S4 domain-containing protein [Acidocella sp.]